MANWQKYYNEFMMKFPSLQTTMGNLNRSSALAAGSASRQAAGAYTGSPTSGAFGSMYGNIWSDRMQGLTAAEAQLTENEKNRNLQLMQLAMQKAQSDQQGKLGGLAGLGKLGALLAMMVAKKTPQGMAASALGDWNSSGEYYG